MGQLLVSRGSVRGRHRNGFAGFLAVAGCPRVRSTVRLGGRSGKWLAEGRKAAATTTTTARNEKKETAAYRRRHRGSGSSRSATLPIAARKSSSCTRFAPSVSRARALAARHHNDCRHVGDRPPSTSCPIPCTSAQTTDPPTTVWNTAAGEATAKDEKKMPECASKPRASNE